MMGVELELVGIAEVSSVDGENISKAKIIEGNGKIKEGDIVSKYTEEPSSTTIKGKGGTYLNESGQHSH